MAYHRLESVVDQHLTQDMANYQLSRSLVSVGYYVNVETRSSIAHSHPYYELILVRRGVCEYLSGGARFLLHPDELLFISPGTVHTMICPEDSESYERLILQINADFMTQVLEMYRLDGSRLPSLYILRAESVCRWGLRELVERRAGEADRREGRPAAEDRSGARGTAAAEWRVDTQSADRAADHQGFTTCPASVYR